MASVQSPPGPDKASALSVILARHWALKVVRQVRRSVNLHEISHCLLHLLCSCFAHCPCFAHCCHDPFIVRSTQTCPPFTGFTKLAHPSRCSRSTLTTLNFYTRIPGPLCLYRGCSLGARSIIGLSPSSCSGVWDPSSVEYINLAICNVVVVLKQRLASFQNLRNSFPS